LRNSLRNCLYRPGEPPTCRASLPFTRIHTISIAKAELSVSSRYRNSLHQPGRLTLQYKVI
jgi:hypothetical protein